MKLDLSSSQALIRKLKTYFPNLTENEESIGNALSYVINGFPEIFGANIKRIRESKHVSQKEMATALGVTPSTYSYWETGSHPPRLTKVLDLIDVLSSDPCDFISDIPVLDQSEIMVNAPLYNSDFFVGKSNDNVDWLITRNVEQPTIKVSPLDCVDFVYKVSNTDMIGEERAIPLNAYAYCSFSRFKDVKNQKDRMAIANGKVALVSICSYSPTLREVKFDGTNLTLVAWNKKVKEDIFPVYSENYPVKGTIWNGGETFAHNVSIYAIVSKVVIEI